MISLVALIQSAGAEASDRQYNILVVDDEPDIGQAVKGLLEKSIKNAHVIAVTSGQSGLNVLRDSAVDLIVTDYKMPGMNGVEFLAAASQIQPQAPRILITAFEQELANEMGSKSGAVVFTKPLEPRPLVRSCQQMLAAGHA